MYRYDKYDQAMVDARVEEFRDQTRRRLEGKLNDDQFKPLRLKNGLYLQLHAYMLRVAIPYGTFDAPQMRKLADIARRYDRGYGHFTTRQNIQYNWIKLAEAPDLLAELATVEMHAIQTSGESIRNVSADQYAGAAADEIIDEIALGEEVGHLLPPLQVLAQRQHLQRLALADGEAIERGHLDDARSAPGRPEVDEDGPAAEVGDPRRAAVRVLERHRRRGRARMGAVEAAGRIVGRGARRRRRGVALRLRGLLPIASRQRGDGEERGDHGPQGR